MTTLREAAQRAMKSLEDAIKVWTEEMEFRSCVDASDEWLESYAALREALAEPEQKPVAHCTLEQLAWLQRVVPSTSTIGLYISPPQHKPLKDGSVDYLFGLNHFHTIEKAHGIGDKE